MATDIMATSHTKLTRPILLTRFIRFALAPLKMRTNSLRSAQFTKVFARNQVNVGWINMVPVYGQQEASILNAMLTQVDEVT